MYWRYIAGNIWSKSMHTMTFSAVSSFSVETYRPRIMSKLSVFAQLFQINFGVEELLKDESQSALTYGLIFRNRYDSNIKCCSRSYI